MTNRIEQLLIDATGLQRKRDETFQKWAGRLILACHDLSEDDWDRLKSDAQTWVNEGAKAINKEKSIPNFPADAEEDEPVGEEEPVEEPEEDTGEPEEDTGEPVENGEPEPEEEDRPRGRRREPEPEEEPEEERPTRSRRREPEPEEEPEEERPRGRRREPEPEEEPEERPRGRRREPEPEEEPEERPRNRREPVKPKPQQRRQPPPPARKVAKEPEGKGKSATTLLKKMLIRNPKLTTEEILDELKDKHGLEPSRLAMASIRSAFLHSCKVLKEHKLLGERLANRL